MQAAVCYYRVPQRGEPQAPAAVNVAPLTLGVATLGGIATPLMARTTPVPVNHSEILITAADMRMTVTVHIFQTERPMAADNVLLGHHGWLTPISTVTPRSSLAFTSRRPLTQLKRGAPHSCEMPRRVPAERAAPMLQMVEGRSVIRLSGCAVVADGSACRESCGVDAEVHRDR
jgi:hypothetical protein